MGLGYGSVVSHSKGDDMTFEEVQKLVMSYVCVRQWNKTKSSRGLAISLSLEANELLEYFQWSDTHIGTKDDMASELAELGITSRHDEVTDGYDILMKKLRAQ